MIFNRVHEELPADAEALRGGTEARIDVDAVHTQLLAAGVPAAHVSWLAANFIDYQRLARGEALRMEQFRTGLSHRVPFVTVPNFDTDLHDLASLTRMHAYLFAPEVVSGAGRSAAAAGSPGRSRGPRAARSRGNQSIWVRNTSLDMCCMLHYTDRLVIKNFRRKTLRDFFETGRGKSIRPDLQERVAERLDVLDNVTKLDDLNLPGYGLHRLKGEKKGRHAISVNGPGRITFEWDGENALKVDLEQYH